MDVTLLGKIQIRRGTTAQRLNVVFDNGEPAWDETEQQLYIGDGETLGGIPIPQNQPYVHIEENKNISAVGGVMSLTFNNVKLSYGYYDANNSKGWIQTVTGTEVIDLRRMSVYDGSIDNNSYDNYTLTTAPLNFDVLTYSVSNEYTGLFLRENERVWHIHVFISLKGARSTMWAQKVYDPALPSKNEWVSLNPIRVSQTPEPQTSPTPTPTVSVSQTPEITPTPSESVTPTPSVSVSANVTPTPTSSVTPSITPSISVSVSGTPPVTPSQTASVTPSVSVSSSVTPTVTPTVSLSNTPTVSVSASPSPTAGVTPTVTPTITPTISNSASPTPSVTASITPSVSVSATPAVTATPTITPSVSLSATPSSTAPVTPTVTPTRSVTPSITPSVSVSATRSPTPTPTPTGSMQAVVIQPLSAGGLNLGLGQTYNQQLMSTGGTGNYTYVIVSGTLPPGLSMSTGGLISGIIGGTILSTYTATIRSTSGPLSATRSFTWTIVL